MCIIFMKFKTILAISIFSINLLTTSSFASEVDEYLQQKNIIDTQYKIINKQYLKDVLSALNDEDSRVLPIQVDQNTIIEKMQLHTDHIEIQGLITSEDFAQFAQSTGQEKTKQLLTEGLLDNCSSIFNHEFQRKNPYTANITLTSQKKSYQINLKNTQCTF